MTSTSSAAATGLPVVDHPDVFPRFTQADPIPGLATRRSFASVGSDAVEQARAMNAILIELNAILAEGGARG